MRRYFILGTKKYRIYTVCGVSQTPMKLLREKENCHVQAFVDNDCGKQGMVIESVKVYSLKQAVCEFPTAVIFIANEKYHPEIRIQIEKESKGRTVLCPFE